MEMDSIHLDNSMEGIENGSSEKTLISLDSYDNKRDQFFKDPVILPRIGDQYQAGIPCLIAEIDRLKIADRPTDSESMSNFPNHISSELSIPLMWTNREVEKINQIGVLVDSELTVGSDEVEKRPCPLPWTSGKSWTAVERDSFLLALYIFGKNLILVKRFVETKPMGDILSFYYGTFYKSEEYRKLKNRQCVYGRKLFAGWRQDVLLSQLFSQVSEKCKTPLIELFCSFGDGKMSLEKYVFALRDLVGINMLIEAIGIGKGRKLDLTVSNSTPKKSSHLVSVHPDFPIGKTFSSLTSADIIKFLTGEFRLSKARSSDLFWEAVWPRLLAKGWHLEKSNGSLLFVLPGIKKFSRRRLVIGEHYFHSVSDVLSKVASEPRLLDTGNKEDMLAERIKLVGDDDPSITNCKGEKIKFTVMDTSMVHVAERCKVRELRSIPDHATEPCTPFSFLSETEEYTHEKSEDETEETNKSTPKEDTTKTEAFLDDSGCLSVMAIVENQRNGITSLVKPIKPFTCRFSGNVSSRHSNRSIHNHEQPIYCNGHISEEKALNENKSCSENIVSQVSPQNSASPISRAKDSSDRENEVDVIDNYSREMIDLNFPPVPQDLETDETFTRNLLQNDHSLCLKKSYFPSETSNHDDHSHNPLDCEVSMEKRPMSVSRRQSRRNRPMTVKALEAFEYEDFFSVKRKRKRTTVEGSENTITSCHVHTKNDDRASSDGHESDDVTPSR